MTENVCICCSGKAFKACCAPFLIGNQVAKTPKQLMRSRYAAFALGNYGTYLLQTWLPVNAENLSAAELSSKTVDWCGLEIVDHSQSGDHGKVEFKASFLDGDQLPSIHHEKSNFLRVDGQWLYSEGEVLNAE